jgi:alkylated DNA repair dioxygenase AlkB
MSEHLSSNLVFKSAQECIADLERRVSHRPMSFQGRKGAGRQVQCQRCFRWKYSDERCNLFDTVKVPGPSEPPNPPGHKEYG